MVPGFVHARYRLGDARGLEVSLSSLLQNELVERQIRDGTPEPDILSLELLQPFHLIALELTKLLTPAIIRHFGHADLADRIGNTLTLRDQNINLSQLEHFDCFLNKDVPLHRAIERLGAVISRPVLDGLHHQYCRI
jgi:hypothetical protein